MSKDFYEHSLLDGKPAPENMKFRRKKMIIFIVNILPY